MEVLFTVLLFSVLFAIGLAYVVLFALLPVTGPGLLPAHGVGSDHNTRDLEDEPESLAPPSSTHRPTPLCHATRLRNSASGYGLRLEADTNGLTEGRWQSGAAASPFRWLGGARKRQRERYTARSLSSRWLFPLQNMWKVPQARSVMERGKL